MKHYIVAYVNRKTKTVDYIAVSDGPITESPIEPSNHADLDMHFCEVDSIGESADFIRGRKFIEALELKGDKLSFKNDHSMKNKMVLNTISL